MKKIITAATMMFSACMMYASPTSSGATGTIDFPNAYNLRSNNYTVALNVDGIDKNTGFGFTFEGGFIPQIEAGVMLNNKDTKIDSELLKSNFKFQFVQEADNPAIALGFIESRKNLIIENDTVYAYIVASKSFRDVVAKETDVKLSLGVKYNENKDTDIFSGVEFPIFQKIKLLGEVYSYAKTEAKTTIIETETTPGSGTYKKEEVATTEKVKKVSYNIGGEFYTTDTIRTKIYWKEIDNTLGVSINYIGIYK